MTVCTETSQASWLMHSQVSWQQLVSFGPAGFPAYARLRFLPDPTTPGQRESEAIVRPGAPTECEQVHTVLAYLARHTGTPDQCYFCLWDGWWTPVSATPQPTAQPWSRDEAAISDAPGTTQHGLQPDRMQSTPPAHGAAIVGIPNRNYYLLQGGWSDFRDWGALQREDASPSSVPVPSFIWPADHAWCIARDVDPHYAGIGATPAAIQELVDVPRLDVVRADPREEPLHYV